jgi:penicillin-insensitive murein endopeptidase
VRARCILAVLALAAASLVSTDVASAPPRAGSLRALGRVADGALSVGAPNDGRLFDGGRLEESELVRVVPAYTGRDHRWGLPSLVRALERAARFVDKRHPRAMLSVGDLSRRGGGTIGHHHSHQSGRDVDVAFYLVDAEGRPRYLRSFVALDAEGRASAGRDLRFDDARNWAFVEALLSDPDVRIERIFVAAPLRARLLREAERRGVSLPFRIKAAERLMQPRRGVPHDDHFHVRVACPREQADVCEADARDDQPRPGLQRPVAHPSSPPARARGGTPAPGALRRGVASHVRAGARPFSDNQRGVPDGR